MKYASMMSLAIATFAWLNLSATQAAIVIESEVDATAANNVLANAQAIPSSVFTIPVPGDTSIFQSPLFPTATVQGIGGQDDVDFYSFIALGGRIFIDFDNAVTNAMDPILALFDSSGTLLAFGDDSSPSDPGSGFVLDSFVGVYTLPASLVPETYFVAVSAVSNFPNAQTTLTPADIAALVRPDGQSSGGFEVISGATLGDSSYGVSGNQDNSGFDRDYTFHISLENPAFTQSVVVPETSTLVMWAFAVFGGSGLRSWRRRKCEV